MTRVLMRGEGRDAYPGGGEWGDCLREDGWGSEICWWNCCVHRKERLVQFAMPVSMRTNHASYGPQATTCKALKHKNFEPVLQAIGLGD